MTASTGSPKKCLITKGFNFVHGLAPSSGDVCPSAQLIWKLQSHVRGEYRIEVYFVTNREAEKKQTSTSTVRHIILQG